MLIVAYHALGREASPITTAPDQFAEEMQQLRDAGFTFVSLSDAARWLAGDTDLPSRGIAVTFDDGYQSVARDALPVLTRLDIPATVYVIAGRLGGDNAWPGQWASIPRMPLMEVETLRTLVASGVQIGAHSWSHPVLPALSDAALDREIEECGDRLEQLLGVPVEHYSYPYGARGPREVARVRARYLSGVSAHASLVSRTSSAADLPRLDAHDLRLALRLGLATESRLRPYLLARRLLRLGRRRLEVASRGGRGASQGHG